MYQNNKRHVRGASNVKLILKCSLGLNKLLDEIMILFTTGNHITRL